MMADKTEQTASEFLGRDWIDDWADGLSEAVMRKQIAYLMRDRERVLRRLLDPPLMVPEWVTDKRAGAINRGAFAGVEVGFGFGEVVALAIAAFCVGLGFGWTFL